MIVLDLSKASLAELDEIDRKLDGLLLLPPVVLEEILATPQEEK